MPTVKTLVQRCVQRDGLTTEGCEAWLKKFSLGRMQIDSPPADLHLSFIIPPVGGISIMSAPGSQTSSIPR